MKPHNPGCKVLERLEQETVEACAKHMDHLATCELMHDCVDDMARARPYERAAKELRALAAPGARGETK